MHAMVALLLAVVPLGGSFPDEERGVGPRADDPGHRLTGGVPSPGGLSGQAETTVVSVENFRFCGHACRADSVAYVRTPAGPVPGSDNPRAVVYAQAGAQFTWAYRDSGCDLLRCPGHDIRLEDGTVDGRRIGVVTGATEHDRLGWTIPADAEAESIIRYFCAFHAGLGMTGAFQVLPIRVLSVSYPRLP